MTIENIVAGLDSDKEDSQDLYDDWEEEDAKISCTFCSKVLGTVPEFLVHSSQEHAFDFHRLVTILKSQTIEEIGFSDVVRLVNYLRAQTDPVTMDSVLIEENEWRTEEKYLQPVLQDDSLLYFLPDALFPDDSEAEVEGNFASSIAVDSHLIIKSDTSSAPAVKALVNPETEALEYWKLRAIAAETQLSNMKDAFDSYKDLIKASIRQERNVDLSSVAAELSLSSSTNGNNTQSQGQQMIDSEGHTSGYYFGGYASLEIHETMLKDTARTEAYRDFMYLNKAYFSGKIVLDVGCGTGILSMFAAKAGAKHVYAVDNSDIIEKTRRIIEENGKEISDRITLIRGRVEEINLPVEKVDIIVSEWMGYFLLFEGMLDSVLDARDRWLAKDGTLAPSSFNIYAAGISDDEFVNDKVHFWNDVYGFKMNTVKSSLYEEAQVDFADTPGTIVTNTQILKTCDLNTAKKSELDFQSTLDLELTKAARVHGLIGWFDTPFHVPAGESVVLTTSPSTTRTHWKQTVFLFREPIDGEAGDKILGSFECVKSSENERELVVKITYHVEKASGLVSENMSQTFYVR